MNSWQRGCMLWQAVIEKMNKEKEGRTPLAFFVFTAYWATFTGVTT
jgi:hypothetical protein